jgi:DNA-binding GntR family transcriptional regulator
MCAGLRDQRPAAPIIDSGICPGDYDPTGAFIMTEPKDRVHFDALYTNVLGFLDDGVYRPGDRIGIKELADRLTVSPTPMREILSRLVGRGLVEERRSEGYYLRKLDAPDIADLYDLHGVIVGRALRASGGIQVDRALAGVASPWSAFDQLVEASGNSALIDTHRHIAARLRLLRRCETSVFPDLLAEADRLLTLLRQPAVASRAVRLFHHRRVRHARQLAFCVARH